jgi:hypothetical protein
VNEKLHRDEKKNVPLLNKSLEKAGPPWKNLQLLIKRLAMHNSRFAAINADFLGFSLQLVLC